MCGCCKLFIALSHVALRSQASSASRSATTAAPTAPPMTCRSCCARAASLTASSSTPRPPLATARTASWPATTSAWSGTGARRTGSSSRCAHSAFVLPRLCRPGRPSLRLPKVDNRAFSLPASLAVWIKPGHVVHRRGALVFLWHPCHCSGWTLRQRPAASIARLMLVTTTTRWSINIYPSVELKHDSVHH